MPTQSATNRNPAPKPAAPKMVRRGTLPRGGHVVKSGVWRARLWTVFNGNLRPPKRNKRRANSDFVRSFCAIARRESRNPWDYFFRPGLNNLCCIPEPTLLLPRTRRFDKPPQLQPQLTTLRVENRS